MHAIIVHGNYIRKNFFTFENLNFGTYIFIKRQKTHAFIVERTVEILWRVNCFHTVR